VAVTQQELARLAGISKGAVSLALRNHPSISRAMRKRVQQLALEAGYRPHPAYARMANERLSPKSTQDQEPVAFINRLPLFAGQQKDRSNMNDAVLWEAFDGVVRKQGMLPIRLDRDELGGNPVRMLRNRGIRHVVFSYLNSDDPLIALDWREHLVVCIGRGRQTLPFHTVRADLAAAARAAFRKMYALGHHRIGLAPLTMQDDFLDDRERLEGLISACYETTGSWPVIPPLLAPLAKNLLAEIRAWLRTHRPKAVIGFNNLVLVAMLQENIRAPYIGLVLPTKSQTAGYRIQFDRLATEAFGIIEHFREVSMFGLPPHPQEVLVRMEWQDGDSFP